MHPSDLYPAPETPDIDLIGFTHESEFAEIRDFGGYDRTTLTCDETMWNAPVAAGVIAALPHEPLTRGRGEMYNPADFLPMLDRFIPILSGTLRTFAEAFRDIAAAANRQGTALDIWVL